jgi:hypothetical protein
VDAVAWAAAVGAVSAAGSALFAGLQIRWSRRAATTVFEDALAAEYRALAKELPVGAFLKSGMSPPEIKDDLGVFYRYFDLSNQQAFLAEAGRVSVETWRQWADGIESNMRRQAFKDAWFEHIRDAAAVDQPDGTVNRDFDELRRLLIDRRIDFDADDDSGAKPDEASAGAENLGQAC